MRKAILPSASVGCLWFAIWRCVGALVDFNLNRGYWPGESSHELWAWLSSIIVLAASLCILRSVRRKWIAVPPMLVAAFFGSCATSGYYAHRLVDRDHAVMRAGLTRVLELRLPGIPPDSWKWYEPYWNAAWPTRGETAFRVPGGAQAALPYLRKKLPRNWIEVERDGNTEFLSPLYDGKRQDAVSTSRMTYDVRLELGGSPMCLDLLPPTVRRLDGRVVPKRDLGLYGL